MNEQETAKERLPGPIESAPCCSKCGGFGTDCAFCGPRAAEALAESAVVTGAEAAVDRLKELTERFDALVANLKLSQEAHDEERAVRLLAWKIEWDTMMRERRTSIDSHLVAAETNRAHEELSRVMIATRHADVAEVSLHREAMERINERGYENIAKAIREALRATLYTDARPGRCPHGKTAFETCNECPDWGDAQERCEDTSAGGNRCTRHAGHKGRHTT